MLETVGKALESTMAQLAGAASPRAEAEELLTRLLDCSRTELYLRRESRLDSAQRDRLAGWVRRRLTGEPIQYITGRAAFRGLDLAVNPSVLVPRPETEGLVEAVIDVLRVESERWKQPRVLDLGTGSGAIALAIASEWPAAVVAASDSSHEALETARRNAEATGLAGRVTFHHGDWFGAIGADERFEVVVSNPPYIACDERHELPADVRAFEPEGALFSGPNGFEALREIADQAPRYLVAGGLLALELAEKRAEEVAAWLDGARDWTGVALLEDLARRPRVLLARRQSGPAIAPAQWGEETPSSV